MYQSIKNCRICGNLNLVKVLDLGEQTLTGVFPREKHQAITKGPIQLVKCIGDDECCGLLQLAHSYDLDEMYGDNYGYRSGLNPSMVQHLHSKVERILQLVDLSEKSIILDIGSNDGTTLSAYPNEKCLRVGMDPTATKFRQYYPDDVIVVTDFFSAKRFNDLFPSRKAKVVTSFSMFYDLERPMNFMHEVASILDANGVWVFEQSYMPLMLERNSYDTACHEHLEYYALKQIVWMTKRCGLKVIDIEFNDVNGGSFSITAALQTSIYHETEKVSLILEQEKELGLDTLKPYFEFQKRVTSSKEQLVAFVKNALNNNKTIGVLGASTKGNVLLQYCEFDESKIQAVGEVNPDKFGSYTPGTLIPIVNEQILLASHPDYLIVLPWHFRDFFIEKYKFYEGSLVFPLPELYICNIKEKVLLNE